ncbi:MAG: TonB-dependent receptor [Verrucomicrobia bacterium]|nr:TonB-dependent receptor [Verrucomicrobiota bacterium]
MQRAFRKIFSLGFLSCVAATSALLADDASSPVGTVSGTTVGPGQNKPLEFVAVTLKHPDGSTVESTVSDQHGRFTLEKVTQGDYVITYGQVGNDARTTSPFTVDAQHKRIDLGALTLADDVIRMESFQVKASQQAQLNSIDRKVYVVGRDIQGATGAASDLLQNIPSVQVDIDGNVSLRGSDNVLILINGRTSSMMGKNRADVLAQLSGDEIEKIEVVTNPSAKYKPDGTAGIINIVLKHQHASGFSGSTSVTVGNESRASASISANYHPDRWNIFGSYNIRQDDRPRFGSDVRTIVDPITGAVTHAEKHSVENSRPLSHLVRGGFDFAPNAHNQVGFSANMTERSFFRTGTDHNVVSNASGVVTSDYDRLRTDPEYQHSLEFSGTFQHTFDDEGHDLNVELKSSREWEQENDFYTDLFRFPVQPPTKDNTRIKNDQRSRELVADYNLPLADSAKLAAGYDLTNERIDSDFFGEDLDPVTGLWVTNAAKTNRFTHERTIHAFYSTYARAFGPLGVQLGLRPELAYTRSRLVNTGQEISNDYARIYPTLHLSYKLTEEHELQANYSRRVHRPDIDDLNPFPEYQDPFTLRTGNPRLQPEDIHSIEAGYGFRRGETSFTATVYERFVYHGITNVTSDIGNGVLLTTKENLSVSRFTGLELTANADVGKWLTFNASTNTYFNTIDASNLGFSSSKSDVSWIGKLGASFRLPAGTLLQFNTNYTSRRLTPQGTRQPTFVANLGLRKEIWKKKAAIVFTVSDVFNSLRDKVVLDTPVLREEFVRRRSARVIYVGFTYNFGTPSKKSKEETLKFDNSL